MLWSFSFFSDPWTWYMKHFINVLIFHSSLFLSFILRHWIPELLGFACARAVDFPSVQIEVVLEALLLQRWCIFPRLITLFVTWNVLKLVVLLCSYRSRCSFGLLISLGVGKKNLKDLADEYWLEMESKCDISLDKLVFDVIGSFSMQESDFYLSFSLFIFVFLCWLSRVWDHLQYKEYVWPAIVLYLFIVIANL